MKKVGKYIVLSLIAFLIGIGGVFAKEFDLQTVGELVLGENPDAESFYIVGKYVFTMSYVKQHNLDTEDLMLAGHSIVLEDSEKKIKGTDAYKKMSVYQILSHTDSAGSVLDWYVGQNLFGQNKIDNNTKFEINYIDYVELENIYTVIFADEFGKELERHEVVSGRKIAPPMSTTKKGYYFDGWYTEENELFDPIETSITKDMTLKQHWTAKKVTVKFDENIEGETKEKTYTYPDIKPTDLKDTKPQAREGYIFKYWYDSDNDEAKAFDFDNDLELNRDGVDKTITLKAKWEEAHKVIFKEEIDNKANNKFITEETSRFADDQNKLNDSQIPNTDSQEYKFLGWYTEDDKPIKPTEYTFSDKETVLIGKWETNVYTVTFDTDGGTEISNRQVKHGSTVENPGNAQKASDDKYNGYEFEEWLLCESDKCENAFDFANTQITSNIKLKAKYKQVVYTNKMMNDFASQITDDNISAYAKENTKLDIAIIDGSASLSGNINKIVKVLSDFVTVKNIESIRINENTVLTKNNAEQALKDLFSGLGEDFNSAKLENLSHVTFTVNFTLSDGFTDETNTRTSTYQAEFTSNFEIVHNEEELKKALASDKEIIIKDWEGSITEPITISRNTVIDGRNNTITSEIKDNKPVFDIKSDSVVIKDLTLNIDVLKPSEYDKKNKTIKGDVKKNTIGVEVEKDATLTANNFHVKNKETIDYDSLKIGDDVLGASTVTINKNAAILLKGTLYASNISYEDEIYGSPTVLATKDANMNVLGGNRQEYIYNVIRDENGNNETAERVQEYVHYYKDYKHSRLIFINYVPMSRTYTSISHIDNEMYYIPSSFNENGANYKYLNETMEKKYVFKNSWDYSSDLESGNISNEILKKKKATLTSGDFTYYAQYNEIAAPTVNKFYFDKENTSTTYDNTEYLYLTWNDEDVKEYCLLKDNNKNNCDWQAVNGEKSVTRQINFNGYNDYTYYAYLKNNEDLVSKVATAKISYIKKDFNGKASALMDYQPAGLSKDVKAGMYRYSGLNVENYICFGTDDVETCKSDPWKYLYQIIGVTEGGKFKLIKSTTYIWHTWNNKYTVQSCGANGERCKYPTTTMYTLLNKDFATSLPKDWDKKVDTATWYIGALNGEEKTGEEVYQKEKKEWTTNGKYGLMYASDFYYAYDANGNVDCKRNACRSYLSTSNFEWTITRQQHSNSVYSLYIYHVHPTDQMLRGAYADWDHSVRPVFYLKGDTEIKSGTGSKDRPFIIK